MNIHRWTTTAASPHSARVSLPHRRKRYSGEGNMPPRLYLFTALLPCACGFGLAAPLQAAAPATGSVGEIIVTANKRSEPLSKVAISATAIGQADLTQKGVQNLTDLSQRIPGLNIQQTISIGGPQIT